MRINILSYYIKPTINFNNYYHFYGKFLSHIYIFSHIKYENQYFISHYKPYKVYLFPYLTQYENVSPK